ncbi:hypothetical protein [Agarilytica rhodophyticola]|uniref:hypothetical protein n=1 Tax=Agarilytica rhodophyticola TaxID=1737490 RepID=UPI000B344395|nr:hypothetical protein [Agarilytica rhodophyticola]
MNKINLKQRLHLVVTITILCTVQNVQGITAKQCFDSAKTDLEKVYCQLVEKGKGQSLPAFNEFRRNPATTQNLLLRGPAKRAGITLPKVSKRNASRSVSKKRTPVTSRKAEAKTYKQQPSSKARSANSKRVDHGRAMQGCEIHGDRLICGQDIYYMAINIPANRLPNNALTNSNRLQFPEKPQEQEALQYLSSLYPRYIEKMLTIGLGDSTISFTKFHAIYKTSMAQQNSFTERFGKMYELLKKERKSQAIKQRYRNNFPQSIEQCMQLSKNLVACDNVEQNWVYQRLTGERG